MKNKASNKDLNLYLLAIAKHSAIWVMLAKKIKKKLFFSPQLNYLISIILKKKLFSKKIKKKLFSKKMKNKNPQFYWLYLITAEKKNYFFHLN